MKFLCLAGAYGSAKNFSVQMGPFAKHMEERGIASFKYANGPHEVNPPAGWENYFGQLPLYRWIDVDDFGDAFEILRRVRHIPRGLSPEETVRLFKGSMEENENEEEEVRFQAKKVQFALDYLFKILEDDPEIDGIIGYSEGAMLAGSLLAEENKRWEEKGITRHIKFGIFFAGGPPMGADEDSTTGMLADECGTIINVPTCHVLGTNDPLVYNAMALFNVCNQSSATLYDHGLGHLIPRDTENVQQLGDMLEKIITRINKAATAGTGTPCSEFTEFSDDFTEECGSESD